MRRLTIAFVAGTLILPAFGCALAWLGAWSVDATAPPPRWSRLGAHCSPCVRGRARGANREPDSGHPGRTASGNEGVPGQLAAALFGR